MSRGVFSLMNIKQALKIAEDGYAPLFKATDFLLSNLSLAIIINTAFVDETAIDVAGAFFVVTFFYCLVSIAIYVSVLTFVDALTLLLFELLRQPPHVDCDGNR